MKHCTVRKSPDRGAVCAICGKKLLLKRNLKRHITEVHDSSKKHKSKEEAVIKCDNCGKVYASRNKLVEHKKKKHGELRDDGPKINAANVIFRIAVNHV